MTFLKPYENQIYAAMRIVVGFMFFCHGVQKLMTIVGGAESPMPTAMLWGTALIEGVGGGLVALGLRTSLAAFICSGQMMVAYFLVHQKDGILPIQNHGELAALFSWIFLLISVKGAGIWSFDGASKA
jgi:putative oxidoreductase